MHRYRSPFQGADTAGVPVSQHTAHGIQQFGFRTEHEEVQSPSHFAPLVKPYDHIRVPPQRPPSTCSPSFADTLSHEQPPSRGASPSPASLFSHQSSASSSYTHFSSSGASLEVSSERESSGPCPPFHHPNFRPTSPPARIASPYNRPPSRIITRPGSPLVRHQAWMHSATVARPASRRSYRPGSQSIDHSIHQPTRQMNRGNGPHAGEEELDLDDQCTSNQDCRERIMSCGNDSHDTVSASTFSAVLGQLEDAPELRSERPTHNSAPSPDTSSSQDASTMTGLSDSDEPSPRSPGSDESAPEQKIRVLRRILEDELDLRLGTCDPPEDMVSAVADCLDRIDISRRQCRLHGHLIPVNLVPNSNDSTAPESTGSPPGDTSPGDNPAGGPKKRGMSDMRRDDQDDAHEDDDGDDEAGGAGIAPNPAGDRKRVKLEAYACPFRKRNPIRFNIREWEYCAKAPFKSIPELKKHLNKCHKQVALAYKCDRCHMSFSSPENRKAHLRKDPSQMCEVNSDREESPTASNTEVVSSTVGDRFRSRNEHFDWKGIWQALFPEDPPDEIPSPGEPPTFAAPWPGAVAIDGLANWTAPQDFEPPVEIHEVIQEFKGSLAALSNELSTGLGPGSEKSAHKALGIINGFVDGVFQRARIQALAGTLGSTSLLSPKRHTQFSHSNSLAPPILRANAGTPSSTTTSSSGSRQRWSRNGGLSTAHTSGASTPASQLRDSPSLITTRRESMSPRGHAWSNSSRSNFNGQQPLQSGFLPPTVSPLPNHSNAVLMTAPVLDSALTMPVGFNFPTDGGVQMEELSGDKQTAIHHPPTQEHGSLPHSFQRQNPGQNQPQNLHAQPVPFDSQIFSQSQFHNTPNLPGHGTFPVGSGSSAYQQGTALGSQNLFSPWPNISAYPMVPAPGANSAPATASRRCHLGAYVPEMLGGGGDFQFHGNDTSSTSDMNPCNAYHPV